MRREPRLGLDFASGSRWRKATVACLTIGVLGSLAALWHRHELLAQRALALSQIDALQRTEPGAPPPRSAIVRPETMKDAVQEVDRLIASLQRPWEPMLNALQAASRDDVLVLRVQPETDAFRLRLSGQADSSQAFVEFVQRLQANPSWRTVEPLSEARTEAGRPDAAMPEGKPLSFQLAVEWRRP